MTIEAIKKLILNVPDFPKKGILFRDITPLLADSQGFAEVVRLMSESIQKTSPTKIVGIESRGFILGAAMAMRLGVGFVPVRKRGKLPRETVQAQYQLEYGDEVIELHRDALSVHDRVTIVDDVLATGGTALSTAKLCEQLKAKILGFEFLIELSNLGGESFFITPRYRHSFNTSKCA